MADDQLASGVLDLLTGARWSRALFTTYSLSLSFFEAFVLRRLEDVGCNNISVLVDESFYLQSLSERQASRLGKSYRLYPVSCGSGIFHPKVTYLWGDEYDVIAVGSGNLTYAGHGANLECVDFASSAREPETFADFANFLDALLERPSLELNGCRELLPQFRARATAQALRRVPAPQRTRPVLLHSTREPIGVQIPRLLKEYGQFQRILCASPFHHAEGQTLAALATSVGATRVDVCLDPDGIRAPFPKETLRPHGLRTRFVVPDQKESRPLHAKWYEFHGQNHFILSGSVNATQTSFSSTDNIEVALLRSLDPQAATRWIEREPKKIEASVFVRTERVFQGAVTAVLEQDGMLEGRIVGIRDPKGVWTAELITMLGRTSLGQIEVDSAGHFAGTVPDEFQDSDSSVHIRLTRRKEVAAGWVAIRVFLEESIDTRGARLALSRLSRGEAVEGDVARIVHWLTTFVQDDIDSPRSHSANNGDDQSLNQNSRWLTYDDWVSGPTNQRRAGTSVSELVRRALAILARGREAALSSTGPMSSLNPNLEDESDDSGPKAVTLEEFDVVWDLIKVINRVLDLHPENPIGVELALFKAEHGLRSATGQDVTEVLASRGIEWLRWATSIRFPNSRRPAMEPVVVAMAACVAGLTPPTHSAARAAELREVLQRYLESWSLVNLKSLGTKGMEHRIFSVLTPERREGLVEALDTVWNARTIRDELLAFVEDIESGRRPNASPSLEQSIGMPVLKALWERVRDPKCKFGRVPAPENADRCPCPGCGLQLDPSERSELRHRRAIKCRGCGRAILWLRP